MPTSLSIGVGLKQNNLSPTFSPSVAGSALAAWFDATDATTMFSDTAGTTPITQGGSVAKWNDKSGNGRHVTQAGASTLRPTWDGSKLGFDGGDYLFNTSPFMYANGKIS